jgi:hypothetical protein
MNASPLELYKATSPGPRRVVGSAAPAAAARARAAGRAPAADRLLPRARAEAPRERLAPAVCAREPEVHRKDLHRLQVLAV